MVCFLLVTFMQGCREEEQLEMKELHNVVTKAYAKRDKEID